MSLVYFQPPGIKKEYCEAGWLMENDPLYIYFLDETCKILISEVNIIDKENVIWIKKSGVYKIITK